MRGMKKFFQYGVDLCVLLLYNISMINKKIPTSNHFSHYLSNTRCVFNNSLMTETRCREQQQEAYYGYNKNYIG